jgi:hypothetical protein
MRPVHEEKKRRSVTIIYDDCFGGGNCIPYQAKVSVSGDDKRPFVWIGVRLWRRLRGALQTSGRKKN